jgi:hypothetical protein
MVSVTALLILPCGGYLLRPSIRAHLSLQLVEFDRMFCRLGFNKLSNPLIMGNNSVLRRKALGVRRRKVRHVLASVNSTS